jgi:hypothetical protein
MGGLEAALGANGGNWPGVPVRRLRRQLTKADRTRASTVSFLARSRTYVAGEVRELALSAIMRRPRL